MDSITQFGTLSATTNRLVEFVGKPIVKRISEQLSLSDEAYGILMRLTSVFLGILQAIMWNINFFSGYPSLPVAAGYIFTGLSIGLGAEVADVIIDFFYSGKPGEKPDLDPTNGSPVVVAPTAKSVQVELTTAATTLAG